MDDVLKVQPLTTLINDQLFKSIISDLEAVKISLRAYTDTAPERARLAAIRATLESAIRTGKLERVIDALLPHEVPPFASVWHARRNAEVRLALVVEHGAWTAAEVAEGAGSRATNRSALASAWRSAGRVLAVEWNGTTLFPAFQFDSAVQPRPAIASALTHLRAAGLSDWQQAPWFTTGTGWLNRRRPVDLLDVDPAAVVVAAAAFHERPT
jgi:hypothetical protein